jgi:hypothetical protein
MEDMAGFIVVCIVLGVIGWGIFLPIAFARQAKRPCTLCQEPLGHGFNIIYQEGKEYHRTCLEAYRIKKLQDSGLA